MRNWLLLVLSCCLAVTGFAHPTKDDGNKAIDFIENKGQWMSEAKYKAEIPGGALFITDNGFVYNFVSQKDIERVNHLWHDEGKDISELEDEIIHYHAYKINLVNANPAPTYTPTKKRSYYHNYFIGNDKTKWAGGVRLFGAIQQRNIYDGVNLVVYSNGSGIKYDFKVQAGADPTQIRLSFDGVQPTITGDGDLKIKTTVNQVIEKAPVSYQMIDGQRTKVLSEYVLKDGILTFEFPEGYNKNYELIIDPDLVFATYSGSNSSSVYSYTTTYDDEGCLYAGGDAWSTGWPVTTGAYQTTYGGAGHEAAINKYSSDGTSLIYSTYFGGNGRDYPHAMRVNDQGELVVVGSTQSGNLPVSTGCYSNTFSGSWDMFIAHFNSTGTDVIGATYMGGAGLEPQQFTMTATYDVGANHSSVTTPMDLDFDAAGNIWVISNTTSGDFPTTTDAQQPAIAGGIDGVIFELSPDCSNLLYSSYLGGNGNDGPTSLMFNSVGNMILSGITSSSDFPTTPGAMITTAPGGIFDGFVAIVDPGTGSIVNATYLGTSGTDHAVALQTDCADNIYVLGRTTGNYPISPNVWTTFTDGDVFIDELTPDLSASLLSTRLGNSQGNYSRFFPSAFLVDICGRVYVAGFSAQTGMPLTPDAFQSSNASFWFCTLEPGFNDVVYASYFGVSGDHNHIGVNRMDPQGIVYHSVCNYTQYPFTAPTVWSPSKQTSGQDMVSFKFNFDAVTIDLAETSSQGGHDPEPHCIRGCKSAFFEISRRHPDTIPVTIHYELSGTAVNGVDYEYIADSIIIPANDSSALIEIKPLLVPNMPTGMKEVTISVLSPCGCDGGGNNIVAVGTIRIYDSLYVHIQTPMDTICSNTPIEITAEIDSTLNYQWQPAQLIPDPTPLGLTIHPIPIHTTTYSITVTQPGAPATCPPNTARYTATVEPIPQVTVPTKDTIVCIADSIDLNVYAQPFGPDYIFNWSPATYLRNDYASNNKFKAPVGDYKYVVTATTPWAGCQNQDSFTIHVVPPFEFTSVTPEDTTIKRGDTVHINSRGNAVAWLWSPVTYLNDPTLPDPTARPLESTIYTVVGWDQYGCKDTAYVNIDVAYESKLLIPNAFSPNGDGRNDVFRIEGLRQEKLLSFKIYNRLGQLIFDASGPKDGWDGTINGDPAPVDTYFYFIKLTLPGGTPKTIKGDLILIR